MRQHLTPTYIPVQPTFQLQVLARNRLGTILLLKLNFYVKLSYLYNYQIKSVTLTDPWCSSQLASGRIGTLDSIPYLHRSGSYPYLMLRPSRTGNPRVIVSPSCSPPTTMQTLRLPETIVNTFVHD